MGNQTGFKLELRTAYFPCKSARYICSIIGLGFAKQPKPMSYAAILVEKLIAYFRGPGKQGRTKEKTL